MGGQENAWTGIGLYEYNMPTEDEFKEMAKEKGWVPPEMRGAKPLTEEREKSIRTWFQAFKLPTSSFRFLADDFIALLEAMDYWRARAQHLEKRLDKFLQKDMEGVED